jgi:HrpA-like RNA helicase
VLEEAAESSGTRAPRTVAQFLACAVEPPAPRAVENAVALLEGIGALAAGERLTRLGRHLAALPLPPIAGKMLLYGILFGVLDPVLTVACAQVGAQCS